jgi:hypothetical protein
MPDWKEISDVLVGAPREVKTAYSKNGNNDLSQTEEERLRELLSNPIKNENQLDGVFGRYITSRLIQSYNSTHRDKKQDDSYNSLLNSLRELLYLCKIEECREKDFSLSVLQQYLKATYSKAYIEAKRIYEKEEKPKQKSKTEIIPQDKVNSIS